MYVRDDKQKSWINCLVLLLISLWKGDSCDISFSVELQQKFKLDLFKIICLTYMWHILQCACQHPMLK